MSNQRWKARWKADDIGFHQPRIHDNLPRFWPSLALPTGSAVLVPLCGKSHDLAWLQEQEHRVIGVELSHIAIEAFFAERALSPQRQRRGRFTRWSHGSLEIWCGDLFDLKASELGEIAAIYDCTSLTALPEQSRPSYVRHLSSLLEHDSQILLLTTESGDQSLPDSAQTPDSEVLSLYQSRFCIDLLYGQSGMTIDPAFPHEPAQWMDEKVYRMGPH